LIGSYPQFPLRFRPLVSPALDDPRKVVKVVASDGKTGDTRDVHYTSCKVIGNGSFGVVYQAKLVSDPGNGEDIAIKKVLQDKRFKVCTFSTALHSNVAPSNTAIAILTVARGFGRY